jgi:riboflavin synthase
MRAPSVQPPIAPLAPLPAPPVFTGIVEATVLLSHVEALGRGARFRVPAPDPGWAVRVGESVALSGCCLTVTGLLDPETGRGVPGATPGASMTFDLSPETLARTWFRAAVAGTPVNLERALRLGDRLGGHMVSGHVDAVGQVVSVEPDGAGGRWIVFEVPGGLERYLIEKGSITIDGVSLTVVEPAGRRFGVAVIPTTLQLTTLGRAEPGRPVHLEADLVGKWIEKLLPPRG